MSEVMENTVGDDQAIRAGTWRLLGALLAGPPDEALLSRLRGLAGAADDAREDAPMGVAWEALREMAEAHDPDGLAAEYQDLFIGAPEGEIQPYASWYLNGALMDRALIRLRDALRELGIVRQDDVSEPEDHAAAICEVMAFLIEDPDNGINEQKAFFEAHVDAWFGDLMKDLQEAESARGYRAVGVFGERYLALEGEYLRMLA